MELPRGIRRRGDAYLVDVSYQGRRVTATCHTLQEAKVRQTEIKAALKRGKSKRRNKPRTTHRYWTLQKSMETATEVAWNDSKSAHKVAVNVRQIIAHFGAQTRLDQIDTLALDKFILACKRQGNSDGTINRKLSCLRKAMKVAQDRGGCPVIPKMPKRKEKHGRIRYLEAQEEALVVSTLRQWGRDHHADAVIVLIDTGLRLGEFLRLAKRDVDMERGLLSVWVNKADFPRSVPMTTRVKAIVQQRMKLAELATDRLFPIEYEQFHRSWNRVRLHLGMDEDEQFVIHTLRHTCASRLVQRGVPLKVVQEWLGHKSITTTMRYAHLSPKDLIAAAGALEDNSMTMQFLPRTSQSSLPEPSCAGSPRRRFRPKPPRRR